MYMSEVNKGSIRHIIQQAHEGILSLSTPQNGILIENVSGNRYIPDAVCPHLAASFHSWEGCDPMVMSRDRISGILPEIAPKIIPNINGWDFTNSDLLYAYGNHGHDFSYSVALIGTHETRNTLLREKLEEGEFDYVPQSKLISFGRKPFYQDCLSFTPEFINGINAEVRQAGLQANQERSFTSYYGFQVWDRITKPITYYQKKSVVQTGVAYVFLQFEPMEHMPAVTKNLIEI